VRFWLLAWIFAFALWMVHDDSAKLPELLAGIGIATLAATGTELVRRQRVAAIAVRRGFVARAWRVVVGAVPDIGRLTIAALQQLVRPQPVRGRVVSLPFRDGGEAPSANGRRALAEGLGSFAPNTIVIGIDPERDRVIAHQLTATSDDSDVDPLGLG